MISTEEIDRLTDLCKKLSPAKGNYLETDYVRNLLLTVLDFQMQGVVVEKAIRFYIDNRWSDIRTLDQLETILERYPDDKDGNISVALYLWNNRHWTRVGLLRRLVQFFRATNVTTQEALRDWAANSQFDRDFKGRIKGMDLAIYNWLIMRQGVETVKPDVHLHRFVERALEHRVSDADLICALEDVARRMSLKAYELDWRIWEFQRGSGLGFWETEFTRE
jgi:hypothetical protein